jgi:hypothetical protein
MNPSSWLRLPHHKHIPLLIFLLLFVGTALTVLLGEQPDWGYKEGHMFTVLSCFLLMGIAVTALLVYRDRSAKRDFGQRIHEPAFLWVLIAAGFFYLGLDDYLCFHERIGHAIQALVGITPLTERIDSVLIMFYGAIGLFALWYYRKEMGFFRAIWVGLAIGFVCMAISQVLDILCDDEVLFRRWFSVIWWKPAFKWSSAFEDAFKVMAEAYFLRAFLEARLLARTHRDS